MTTMAAVMCTLCGKAGTVETDIQKIEAVTSAAVWALHFTTEHPEVRNGASRFVVMTEDEPHGQES